MQTASQMNKPHQRKKKKRESDLPYQAACCVDASETEKKNISPGLEGNATFDLERGDKKNFFHNKENGGRTR
jgi:hypothetical protein